MSKNETYQTAVEIAAQTGRLDLLTAILAVLVIFLGIGAFPVFWFVRQRASDVAKQEIAAVLESIEKQAEDAAISKMEELLPALHFVFSVEIDPDIETGIFIREDSENQIGFGH